MLYMLFAKVVGVWPSPLLINMHESHSSISGRAYKNPRSVITRQPALVPFMNKHACTLSVLVKDTPTPVIIVWHRMKSFGIIYWLPNLINMLQAWVPITNWRVRYLRLIPFCVIITERRLMDIGCMCQIGCMVQNWLCGSKWLHGSN